MKIGAYCSVGVSVSNLVFYASQPVQLYQGELWECVCGKMGQLLLSDCVRLLLD